MAVRLGNILCGGIFAATLIGAASAQSVTDNPNNWITLRPPGGGFRILMPPDWGPVTLRGPNEKLSFHAKQPAPSGRPGVTNCNVVVLPSPEMANYTQATIDAEISKGVPPDMVSQIASDTFQNSSVRGSGVTRVSNQVAWFLSFSGFYESLNVGVYAVADVVELFRPDQTYTVLCLAADKTPQGGEVAWNAWQPVLMTILSTFVIEDWGRSWK